MLRQGARPTEEAHRSECRNGPPNRSAGHAPRGEISSSASQRRQGRACLGVASSLQELSREAFVDSQPPLGRQCRCRRRCNRGGAAGERAERPDPRATARQEGRGAGRAGVGCRRGAEADGGLGRVLRPPGGGRARRRALARRRRRAGGAFPRRRAGRSRATCWSRSIPAPIAPRSTACRRRWWRPRRALAFTKGEVERGQPLLGLARLSPRELRPAHQCLSRSGRQSARGQGGAAGRPAEPRLHRGARAGGGPRRASRRSRSATSSRRAPARRC